MMNLMSCCIEPAAQEVVTRVVELEVLKAPPFSAGPRLLYGGGCCSDPLQGYQ